MAELNEQDRADHQRAEAARRIIEDPLVVEALATLDRDIYETWSDAALTADQREELHRAQMTLRRFVALFEGYLQGGAQARHILGITPEEKTFYQRIKGYFNGH